MDSKQSPQMTNDKHPCPHCDSWMTADASGKWQCPGCETKINPHGDNTISFFVPSKPRGQSRPRFTRSGIAYKASDQKRDENTLAALMIPYRPKSPFAGPLLMDIQIYIGIPNSKPKWFRDAARRGELHPTGPPDVDNVGKNILDVMGGVFFINDKQVVDLHIAKLYGETPGYVIFLRELPSRDKK